MKIFRISFLLLFALGFHLPGASLSGLPEGVANTQKAGDRPIIPAEALKRMQLPPGFQATLFAGEPDVLQPIAFDFDDRGRLWVVECFSYPDWKNSGRDRVLIFEDTDGDGRFDQRKVFWDQGDRLSSIAIGFGGVWLTGTPNLLFLPDRNEDDLPDGVPEVKLDGFTLNAGHNLVNGLAWGPDGWLYGRHGITGTSMVGLPGTPESRRTRLNCSIWRYHPIRKTFQVLTHGTTNPWGLDWDDYGEAFFSNNVIGHLWHMLPGSHYRRMFGEDFNGNLYQLLESTSDHQHWAGGDWTESRGGQGEHDPLGGGHSHSGGMIYLGDNWPSEFRSTFMMANIHGNRLIYDRLERDGSGYRARHGTNFLMAHDPWFRSVSQHYGPDGAVYVSDWNDFGECHDSDGSFRSSGRIYRVHYGSLPARFNPNLSQLSDSELVDLQLHQNDWFVRHARRLLQERAATRRLDSKLVTRLEGWVTGDKEVTRKLRALWLLEVTGQLKRQLLIKLTKDSHEHMRIWAWRLMAENNFLEQEAKAAQSAATSDKSGLVLAHLASLAQQLEPAQRWPLLESLLSRDDWKTDDRLSLMIWYALEELVALDPQRAARLAVKARFPLVRQFLARRLSGL